MARQKDNKALPAALPESEFVKAAKKAGLVPEVGKGAVEGKYRKVIDTKDGRCTGSVDLDAACKAEEPGANRWDYGLGFKKVDKPELAIWVEPHSGSSAGEVKAVLAKLDWLEAKLALKPFADLRALTDEARRQGIKPYVWLSSGTVGIRPGSREANSLAARGMALPRSYLEI
ncbi:hypothetical protein [Zoogloea ramigera]|uniref:hypothetical protein n=1 Tax=Zoogloea ramigera TaxID=350 RepID=UPI003FA273E1